MLLEQFQSFTAENELIRQKQTTLIALSGGIDSVMLCQLFYLSNWSFAVAHVNFQLRGSASDEDAAFCRTLADEYGVKYHETNLDTVSYAKTQGQSIQMAAREYRYEWLESLRKKNGYAAIATAHHLNDSLETVIYNITRGCGLKGLLGIPLRNGKVIRPLLFATRLEIEAFALEQNLNWREDASNSSLKYRRNQIRHQVIPPLREINPGLEQTAIGNLRRWKESYQLFQRQVAQLKEELVKITGDSSTIDAVGLAAYPERATLLYEWLSPLGFTEAIIRDILAGTGSGRRFFSPTHRLITMEGAYHVLPVDREKTTDIRINKDDQRIDIGQEQVLHFRWLNTVPSHFPDDKNIAYLNVTRKAFPLRLRRWKPGDRFQPLGMGGKHQKIQDFFSNQKLSLVEKEQVWLLEADDEICWVVGMRIDERFKVNKAATECLELRVEANS